MKTSMISRFQAVCHAQGLGADKADVLFGELRKRYGEAHRFYHTLGHIERMLETLPVASLKEDTIKLIE